MKSKSLEYITTLGKTPEQLPKKYQENLTYYSTLNLDRQYERGSDIVADIERYRGLTAIPAKNNDEEFGKQEAETFDGYLKLFEHFYDDTTAD